VGKHGVRFLLKNLDAKYRNQKSYFEEFSHTSAYLAVLDNSIGADFEIHFKQILT
jgi:hypothetical protein